MAPTPSNATSQRPENHGRRTGADEVMRRTSQTGDDLRPVRGQPGKPTNAPAAEPPAAVEFRPATARDSAAAGQHRAAASSALTSELFLTATRGPLHRPTNRNPTNGNRAATGEAGSHPGEACRSRYFGIGQPSCTGGCAPPKRFASETPRQAARSAALRRTPAPSDQLTVGKFGAGARPGKATAIDLSIRAGTATSPPRTR